MTDVPFSQNKEIASILLKAYENKQIQRLDNINMENNKMLNTIKETHKGRYISVGHHRVHPETSMNHPKTLNLDRQKQVAIKIDSEN